LPTQEPGDDDEAIVHAAQQGQWDLFPPGAASEDGADGMASGPRDGATRPLGEALTALTGLRAAPPCSHEHSDAHDCDDHDHSHEPVYALEGAGGRGADGSGAPSLPANERLSQALAAVDALRSRIDAGIEALSLRPPVAATAGDTAVASEVGGAASAAKQLKVATGDGRAALMALMARGKVEAVSGIDRDDVDGGGGGGSDVGTAGSSAAWYEAQRERARLAAAALGAGKR